MAVVGTHGAYVIALPDTVTRKGGAAGQGGGGATGAGQDRGGGGDAELGGVQGTSGHFSAAQGAPDTEPPGSENPTGGRGLDRRAGEAGRVRRAGGRGRPDWRGGQPGEAGSRAGGRAAGGVRTADGDTERRTGRPNGRRSTRRPPGAQRIRVAHSWTFLIRSRIWPPVASALGGPPHTRRSSVWMTPCGLPL